MKTYGQILTRYRKAEFIHIWLNRFSVNFDNSKDCKKKPETGFTNDFFIIKKNVGFFLVVIALRCCADMSARLTAVQVHKE